MALTKIDDRGLKTPIDLLDNEKIRFGTTDNDLELYHDGSNSYLTHDGTGHLYIQTAGNNESIKIRSTKHITLYVNDQTEEALVANQNGSVDLYYDGSKKFETIASGVRVPDNLYSYWGDGNDLWIGHNGSDSFMDNNVGHLYIASDHLDLTRGDRQENFITCTEGGAVELFNDGSKKLETTSTGLRITPGGDTTTVNASTSTSSDAFILGVNKDGTDPTEFAIKTQASGGSSVERMRIDSAGNVGIGTTPDTEFHVKGGGTVAKFEGTGGSGFISLMDSDSSTQCFVGCDAGSFKVQTSGSSWSDKLVVDTAGKVYIGTNTSHAGKFIVKDTDNSGNQIWVIGRANGDTGSISFRNNGDDAYTGRIQCGATNGMEFNSAGSTRASLDTSGNFIINDGNLKILTAGHGIDFSATADASGHSSSLFDDYEEGTWTPGTEEGTWDTVSGNYTKIGHRVFIRGYLYGPTDSTSSNDVEVTGLPYTATNNEIAGNNFSRASGDFSIMYVNDSSTRIRFIENDGGGTIHYMLHSDFGSTGSYPGQIEFVGSYRTAS